MAGEFSPVTWILAKSSAKKYTDQTVAIGGQLTSMVRDPSTGHLIITYTPTSGPAKVMDAGLLPPGKSIQSAAISGNDMILTFDDGTTTTVANARGPQGIQGNPGPTGATGPKGADGKQVEIQSNGTYIQWRYIGETWTNLVSLDSLKGKDGTNGVDGKNVEMRVSGNTLQYRLQGDATWTNLFDFASLVVSAEIKPYTTNTAYKQYNAFYDTDGTLYSVLKDYTSVNVATDLANGNIKKIGGGNTGYTAINPYVAGTVYRVGEMFYNPSTGEIYRANYNYTAVSIATDLADGHITKIGGTGSGTSTPPTSAYAQSTPYKSGYLVVNNGKLYLVTKDFTSANAGTIDSSLQADITAGNLIAVSSSSTGVTISPDAYNNLFNRANGLYSPEEVVSFDHEPNATELAAIPEGTIVVRTDISGGSVTPAPTAMYTQNTPYKQGYLVIDNGKMYLAMRDFTSANTGTVADSIQLDISSGNLVGLTNGGSATYKLYKNTISTDTPAPSTYTLSETPTAILYAYIRTPNTLILADYTSSGNIVTINDNIPANSQIEISYVVGTSDIDPAYALLSDLHTELSNRESGDNNLGARITAETTSRQSEVNTVIQNLNKEISDRAIEDAILQTEIDKKADKATITAVGDIATIANGGNFADSGKTFGGAIGATSTVNQISNNHDVYTYVEQSRVTNIQYQGLFDYFGTQAQIQAQTATAGQTSIAYTGELRGVTGVQRGNYDGTSWTFASAVPTPANGMWIYAKKLLNEVGTPFGMAMYKSDGINPITFDTAPFPSGNPDESDITVNPAGALTFLHKTITNGSGSASVLNNTTGQNIAYDNNNTVNYKIDSKLDITGVATDSDKLGGQLPSYYYSIDNPPPIRNEKILTGTLISTNWGSIAPYSQYSYIWYDFNYELRSR